MLPIQYFALISLCINQWNNSSANTAAYASKVDNDMLNSIGFSKKQQIYFITQPCNYKLS